MGDYLQATSIIYDPVLMTEPYIRTTMMWVARSGARRCRRIRARKRPRPPCRARPGARTSCPGKSLLPGLNPKLTDRFGTPYEARLGGAETMYPEYIAKMKTMPRPEGMTRGGNRRAAAAGETDASRGRCSPRGAALFRSARSPHAGAGQAPARSAQRVAAEAGRARAGRSGDPAGAGQRLHASSAPAAISRCRSAIRAC